MVPIVVIAICQLFVLIGGIMSAAVASKIMTTLQIAHASNESGEAPGFTGGSLLPASASLLVDWWLVWILIPLVWVSLASWIANRPRCSDAARHASVASGIVLILICAVWALFGGVLPMLNAFSRS